MKSIFESIHKWGRQALLFVMLMAYAANAAAITLTQEEKLSKEFLEAVFQSFEIIEDPVIVGQVRRVAKRIMDVLPPQPLTYHFYVINNSEYNAFAGPGGHIFVFSGLLAAMDDESELAGILAHEIAHVTNRHISQKIERSKKVGYGTMAALLAGIVLGASGSAVATQAVVAGALATGQALMLAFSREEELEADNDGLKYLEKAGYSAEGILKILNKMRNKEWFGTKQVPAYLRTHPAVEARIANADSWLAQKKSDSNMVLEEDFILATTRVKALYGDKEVTGPEFENTLAAKPQDAMANYGLALLSAEDGRFDAATAYIKKTLTKAAFNTVVLTDLGRIYFLSGRYAKAESILRSTLAFGRFNPESYLYMARTQMALEKDNAALKTFEALRSQAPKYKPALYYLAEVYGRLEQADKAHYYLGHHYRHQRRFKNALFHFEKALAEAKDKKKQDEIKAIVKKLRARLFKAQLEAEERETK
jgi:beta-barrel assembly-enhancing protease